MNCNFGNLIAKSSNLNSSIDKLSSFYHCDWDDEVHDSYISFVNKTLICKSSMDEIINNIKNVSEDFNLIKITECIKDIRNVLDEEKGFII